MRADDALVGKPVLVHDRGRVIAASSEALQLGVEVGCTLRRAEAMWPECAMLPHHIPTVMAVWETVLEALYGLTPCLESIRPGLLMADVWPPEAVCPLLQQWGAGGGVADDRIAAELAAIRAAPGSLRAVPVGGTAKFLDDTPVTALNEIGVDADVIERLGWFGWTTLGKLRPLAKRQLLAQFEQGTLIHRYAQAGDTRPVPPFREPPTIETTFEFEEPAHEPWEIEPVLDWLERAAREQLDQRVACSVTVTLLTKQGTLRSSRLLREPSAQVYPLRQAAYGCLEEIFKGQMGQGPDGAYDTPPRLSVVRATLRLAHLRQAPAVQAELFEPARPTIKKALLMVERRFPGVTRRIVMLDADAYLPEEAFRLDPIEIEETAHHKVKSPAKVLTVKGAKTSAVGRFARPASQSRGKRRSASQAGVPQASVPGTGVSQVAMPL